MFGNGNSRGGRRRGRLALLALGCAGTLGVGLWWARGLAQPPARIGAPTPSAHTPAPTPPAPATPPARSDYSDRVVAYVNDTTPITREDLGEYLIARYGMDKLKLLINRRVIEYACKPHGIVVTAAEIEADIAESLKEVGGVDRANLLKQLLARYKKTLTEWKEDVVRPKLMLTKLCRTRVQVTEEDLNRAFESHYGEKIEGRIILWPPEKQDQARAEYARLRDNPGLFDEMARSQSSPTLKGTEGKVKPFGRFVMGEAVDREAFKLRPGEISPLIEAREGFVVLKCDRRLPADTTVNRDKVRPDLSKEVFDQKVQVEMQTAFKQLYDLAHPEERKPAPGEKPSPGQVLAVIHGNVPITREDLGEYLITRYGAARLELMVNNRLIEAACRARGIDATPEEVEAVLAEDLKTAGNIDKAVFQKEFLAPYQRTLWEWKQDVDRPKVLLAKLCRERVRVTEDDVRQAFEAHYGEKIQARIIIWPRTERRYAQMEYARLRDSEAEFNNRAKAQASNSLSAKGGRIDPFGRHSLGNDDLEKEAFTLQPGEVTRLVETPEGIVLLKCDQRIPPDTSVSLEQVRARLAQEVLKKKVEQEMHVVFDDLRQAARPKLLLKDGSRPEDLKAEVLPELAGLHDKAPAPERGK